MSQDKGFQLGDTAMAAKFSDKFVAINAAYHLTISRASISLNQAVARNQEKELEKSTSAQFVINLITAGDQLREARLYLAQMQQQLDTEGYKDDEAFINSVALVEETCRLVAVERLASQQHFRTVLGWLQQGGFDYVWQSFLGHINQLIEMIEWVRKEGENGDGDEIDIELIRLRAGLLEFAQLSIANEVLFSVLYAASHKPTPA